MLTHLLEISFTPYIPSTLIGLVGLCSGYLYFYFQNKNNNKLDEIKSTASSDRLKAIELYLNEIGTPIDTSNLDPQDKYKLLVQSLQIKTKRYLIIALVAIIISLIIGFLMWNRDNKKPIINPDPINTTSIENKNDTIPVKAPVTDYMIDKTDLNSNSLEDNRGKTSAPYVDKNDIPLTDKDVDNSKRYNITNQLTPNDESKKKMVFKILSFKFIRMNGNIAMHSLNYVLTNKTGNEVKNVVVDFNLQGQWLMKWISAAALGLQEKKIKVGLTTDEEFQLSQYKMASPYTIIELKDGYQISNTATAQFTYKQGGDNIIKIKIDWEDVNDIQQSKLLEYKIDRSEAYGYVDYTWIEK